MLRTKFKYENKQKAITQKLSKQELQFMCSGELIKSGEICSRTIFPDPIELNQCEVIIIFSKTTNNKITNAYVSILIVLDL